MAAPNLLTLTTVSGLTVAGTATTSATAILTTTSNKLYKVRTLYLANKTGTPVTATLDIYRSSVAYNLLYQLPVPASSTLTPIGSDLLLYLEESDSLRITCSSNSALDYVCSYESLA